MFFESGGEEAKKSLSSCDVISASEEEATSLCIGVWGRKKEGKKEAARYKMALTR